MRGTLVNELLENLLVDAKLLQQRLAHLTAVRRPVRLHLRLVGAAEFVAANLAAVHHRHRIGRRGVSTGRSAQEVRYVEQNKRQANERQAPFEPVTVPAHPVEHRHRESSETLNGMP